MQPTEPPPTPSTNTPSEVDSRTNVRALLRRHPYQTASVTVVLIGGFRVLWVARGNFDTLAVLLETTSLTTLGASLVLTFFWVLVAFGPMYPLTSRRLSDPIRCGRVWPAFAYLGVAVAVLLAFGWAYETDNFLLDRQSQPLTGFLWLGVLCGLLMGVAVAGFGAAVFTARKIKQEPIKIVRASLNGAAGLLGVGFLIFLSRGFSEQLDRPLAPPSVLTLTDGTQEEGYVLEDSGEWLTVMDCENHHIRWIRLAEVADRSLLGSCD